MNDFNELAQLLEMLTSSLAPAPSSNDAHWMTSLEVGEDFQQDWLHAEDDAHPWLPIGSYLGHTLFLSNDRVRSHVLLVGAGETGRTAPGLARFWQDFHDPTLSLVFFDPSGELKHLLAERLRVTHSIWEVSLHRPEQGLAYNPLAHVPLIDSALPRSSERQQVYAYGLAKTLMDTMADTINRPIRGHARDLVMACILHLRASDPAAPLQALAALLQMRERLLPLLAESPSMQARQMAQHVSALNGIYMEMLLTTLVQCAAALTHPEIQRLKARDELDFAQLLTQPIALFYTLPPFEARRVRPITALFYQQMTATLTEAWYAQTTARQETDAPALNGIRIVIDDPEALGPLPDLPLHVSQWPDRASNMAFVMGVRERAVFARLYDRDALDLLEAMRTHLVLPGASLPDCNWYSLRCGHTTILLRGEGAEQDQTLIRRLVTSPELYALQSGQALLCPLELSPALISY